MSPSVIATASTPSPAGTARRRAAGERLTQRRVVDFGLIGSTRCRRTRG